MAIRTNVSVSVFNIIRYLTLGIVLDFIVRRSLDSFEHFRRRLSLHRGHPVSVTGNRLDRYNTLRILTSRPLLSGSVLLVITALAYTVELALEYAVDSEAIRYAIPGKVTRAEQNIGVCTLEEMISRGNPLDLALIADKCVLFEDNTYRFYRPVWAAPESATDSLNDDGLRVLCEAVERNLIFEGNRIYGPSATSKESEEVLELINTLSENSYRANGDKWLPFIILNISSNDVTVQTTITTPSEQFTVMTTSTNVGQSSVRCGAVAGGRKGQNTMTMQVTVCLNGYEEDSSLVLTSGSSFFEVEFDDGAAANASREWSTLAAIEVRTRIPTYFKGVRVAGSSPRANARAYAAFLGRSFPQDVNTLNKYGIMYRFCDEIPLPVRNGTSWEEEYEFASSEVRVTATVEEWAIVLAICWVVVVAVAQASVILVAARKKMPDNVLGEGDILRRWAEENSGKRMEEGMVAMLSVDGGGGSRVGRITAALKSA
eukprot:TRINITY_DN1930_c0_g1_i1.p1 TRINITY_DN1930_c0_g1~~TRINITY_DN1930_c0_g1_i1.p1  ORF type:complete len:487 (-),score=62.28 TRINITY_DN1930_c0_g1_i1:1783-3243(-)